MHQKHSQQEIWGLGNSAANSLQSCLTLCNPIDGSPSGSSVPGILQARTLEWVAISFNAWKWKVKVKSLSRIRLLATRGSKCLCFSISLDLSTGIGKLCYFVHFSLIRLPGLTSCLLCLLAVWSWTSYSTSLCLSLFVCKMGLKQYILHKITAWL